MLTRRALVGTALMASLAQPATAEAKLGEDGLYHLDWYLESFLDLAEDLQRATANGKLLAIMWGLKGCPACRRMHEVHLADPAIESYIQTNFEVLHLNHVGARQVADFDGGKLGEKPLGERYGIRFTPTIQFLSESADGLGARKPQAREVARMPGLLDPLQFLAMFRYVREKGYEAAPFVDWLKRNPSKAS